MNHWQPSTLGTIHVSTYTEPQRRKGSLRKAKRELIAVRRFLNTRVKWTAKFAQELQGRHLMRAALTRGKP